MYPTYSSFAAMPFFHGLAFLFLLPFIAIIVAWLIVIKGFALWHAARNRQLGWFIVLLIVNTLGILEVLYLIFWRKDRNAPAAASSSAV
jgi:methionyl-tRNA synthetase